MSEWSGEILVSNVTGATADASTIYSNENVYVSWSVINNGKTQTSLTSYTELYIDNVLNGRHFTNHFTPLNVKDHVSGIDVNIGKLIAGTHMIKIITDAYNDSTKSNESHNECTKTITITQAPSNESDNQYSKKRSITQAPWIGSHNYYMKKIAAEKRLFSGIGGHFGFTKTNNTGIIAHVSYSNIDDNLFSSPEDLGTDGFGYGIYLNLLEYYFNDEFSIGLSSFLIWTGTPTSNIERLNQSEGTFFAASALMLNYSFAMSDFNSLPTSYYFGIGPTLIHSSQMKASATFTQDMSKEEVFAKYSPVYGIAFELGVKLVFPDARCRFAIRLGIPFIDMAVDELSIKGNGVSLAVNKNDMSSFNATYFMLLFGFDIGWL